MIQNLPMVMNLISKITSSVWDGNGMGGGTNFEDTNVLASFWDGQEKAREQLYKYRENLKYLGNF